MDQASQKLRYADVQHGLDIDGLRNWFKRGLVTLEHGYGDGTWTTFTYADLTKLVFVRELVNFGLPIDVAHSISHRILQDEDLFAEGLPVQSYWRAFAGIVIAVGFTRRTAKWNLLKIKKNG